MWWYITGILNSKVAMTTENKAIVNITLSIKSKSDGGFTEIFSIKPKIIPATVVNSALSRNTES